MTTASYIILGSGGHAAVLADALLAANAQVIGCTDNEPSRHGAMVCGLPVLGSDDVLQSYDPASTWLVNGLGSVSNRAPSARSRLQMSMLAAGWQFPTVIHPSAIVSQFAEIQTGAQILAGVVVQARANIGTGVIINTGSVIEHDVNIGAWTHVAPGATVCGDVSIGEFCHIGAGAVVRQGLHIGGRCLVGAGAAVIKNGHAGEILLGIPARPFGEAH